MLVDDQEEEAPRHADGAGDGAGARPAPGHDHGQRGRLRADHPRSPASGSPPRSGAGCRSSAGSSGMGADGFATWKIGRYVDREFLPRTPPVERERRRGRPGWSRDIATSALLGLVGARAVEPVELAHQVVDRRRAARPRRRAAARPRCVMIASASIAASATSRSSSRSGSTNGGRVAGTQVVEVADDVVSPQRELADPGAGQVGGPPVASSGAGTAAASRRGRRGSGAPPARAPGSGSGGWGARR